MRQLAGSKAYAYLGFYKPENVLTTGSIPASTLCFIYNKAVVNSGLPEDIPVGCFFISPATGDPITLALGDRVLKIERERFCKTSISYNAEQGTVDTGDDCNPGAKVLDGIITLSGDLAGVFQYDDVDFSMGQPVVDMINRFFPVIEDTGTGSYIYHAIDNSPAFLLFLLNGDAEDGQYLNWIFTPIIISSMGISGGNSDAQAGSYSWSKGSGEAVFYTVPRSA
jgi:hypothetical protein